ncbi:hypothetical protein BCD49_03290 [Pseudofrankia sp. EUN1h]|nr:hypothetical protein BCD49_03290 [Pseudofrankia sp. EUN1h]
MREPPEGRRTASGLVAVDRSGLGGWPGPRPADAWMGWCPLTGPRPRKWFVASKDNRTGRAC